MKKLDITKPITTRDGRPVTNVCLNKYGDIWGLLDGEMCSRQPDGAICADLEHALDWINPPETHDITVYVYLNAFGRRFISEVALDCCSLVAKCKIKITEGEGL